MELSLRCECGNVSGRASDVDPDTGIHVVCTCCDCQAYARFLGRVDDLLDASGGTEVFQLTPSQLRLDGVEHLRCMRLSQKGLLRWYAGCCKTPVANTMAAPRVPFAGIPHLFIDHPDRDAVLGPVRARCWGVHAVGEPHPDAHDKASLSLILRSIRFLASGALRGKHRPTPFFDASGRPVSVPEVLTPAARDALRA